MECWEWSHEPGIGRSGGGSRSRPVLPFISIVTQGFLSYGFAAMLTVFAFVASVYRPRWKVRRFGVVVSYPRAVGCLSDLHARRMRSARSDLG